MVEGHETSLAPDDLKQTPADHSLCVSPSLS